MINWYHILKILMNVVVSQSFINNIKSRKPSTPLAYIPSYITLLMYLPFLYIYVDRLSPGIDIRHLHLLIVYVASDWLLLLFSWVIQRNIISRRDALLKFPASGITMEKKENDLFDVRYFPEEYMSDV